jgi:DHA1 family inner membrane transport protein
MKIRVLLIDKSAKRPPKWLPIEKPTPISTNMNVMKVGEVALLTTVLGAGAMFTLYTYIAPSLTEFTHASPTFITFMFITINRTKKPIRVLLIDKSAKRPPKWLPIEKPTPQIGAAIALVTWGAATFALVPPLQMRVMSVAHEANQSEFC